VFVALSWSAAGFEFFQPVDPSRAFQVMAHRGASGQAPENTRPALKRAADEGFEWAEVDVRLTKDGHHVIFHDSEVDGKTDGHGRVEDFSIDEIRELDAGSWFSKRFRGERILTLKECMAIARGRLNLYLDCKHVDPVLLADEILDAEMEKQVVVFDDPPVLAKVQKRSKGRIAIMPKWRPAFGTESWVAKWRPDAIEIDAADVTPEICRWFHDNGITVQAKVLGEDDRPEVWDRVLAAGVDWLQTDLAEDIIAHRSWKLLAERPVQISCHRGACRYAPENTMPAFEKAIRLGVDYVEFDIHPSKDGDYFILHDDTLDRTTNGQGAIAETSSDAIRGLDAGGRFGKPYQGLKVPELDEVFALLRGRVMVYVDAKEIPAETLARKLEEHDLVGAAVVYQGLAYLQELHALNPDIRALCPLGDPAQVDALYESVHPYGFDASWDILSPELIQRCHALNVKVFSDAMGKHERIEDYMQAMDWGIDVIQTDYPLRVMRAVEIREAGRPGNSSDDATAQHR